jgi:hypothetical protein
MSKYGDFIKLMIFPKQNSCAAAPFFLNSAKPREISPQKRTLKKKKAFVPNVFAPKKKEKKKNPAIYRKKGH